MLCTCDSMGRRTISANAYNARYITNVLQYLILIVYHITCWECPCPLQHCNCIILIIVLPRSATSLVHFSVLTNCSVLVISLPFLHRQRQEARICILQSKNRQLFSRKVSLPNLMDVGVSKLRSFWAMLCFSSLETNLEKRANSTTGPHRCQ